MTESVGLKNMVIVAAACLSKGWGILRGDSKESDVLGGEITEEKGLIGRRGGKNVREGENNPNAEIGLKKGFGGPNQKGNCANAASLMHTKRKTMRMIKIYLFMI